MSAATAAAPQRIARGIRDALPYVALVVLVAYFSVASDFFLNAPNFERMLTDSATLIIVAMGMTLVILIGEIDLSVGAVTSLMAVVMAQTMQTAGAWPPAVAAALVAATCIGALAGVLTVAGRIPSFIATLGLSAIATGLAYILTGAVSVPVASDAFLDIFYWNAVLGLPTPIWITAVVVAAALVLSRFTAFGRELTALGASAEAARLSGVPVARRRIAVFALMGLCVGIGAVLSTARLGSGGPGSSPTLTLDAIAAVIIGGASLFGGRASVLRTFLGALLIAVLNNGMILVNAPPDTQYMIKGAIILIAVLLERLAARTGGA